MGKRLSQETIALMRKLVGRGMSRAKVARRFKCGATTVCKYTKDLPKRKFKRLTVAEKRRIRKMKSEGMSTADIAKEYGVSRIYVNIICRDRRRKYPNSDRIYLGGKTLEILDGIMKNGYWIGTKTYSNNFKTLRMYLPIKRVHIRGITIYFTEDRKHDAFKGLVSSMRRKTISQLELAMIAKPFGIKVNYHSR